MTIYFHICYIELSTTLRYLRSYFSNSKTGNILPNPECNSIKNVYTYFTIWLWNQQLGTPYCTCICALCNIHRDICSAYTMHIHHIHVYIVAWSHYKGVCTQYYTLHVACILRYDFFFVYIPECCTSAHITYLTMYLYDLCLKNIGLSRKDFLCDPNKYIYNLMPYIILYICIQKSTSSKIYFVWMVIRLTIKYMHFI